MTGPEPDRHDGHGGPHGPHGHGEQDVPARRLERLPEQNPEFWPELWPESRKDGLPLPWAAPAYTSPGTNKAFFASRFPNLGFYRRMLWIVISGGVLARCGKYDSAAWARSSVGTIRAMEKCGLRFEIEGLEQVMAMKEPCVFVGNHMSTLETFALPCLIQPYLDVTYVVKESLLRYPFFGPILASRDPIVVTRRDLRADLAAMLEGGAKKLVGGTSVIVFPQGSRSVEFDDANFNSVGVKIARKAGAPIIPVALRSNAWGNGTLIKDFGPIRPELTAHFKFGSPIRVSGTGKAEQAEIVDFIKTNLAAWLAEGGKDARA